LQVDYNIFAIWKQLVSKGKLIMNVNTITDEEPQTMQRVCGLKVFGAPAHAEMLQEAAPLIAKGWVARNGKDLSIPDDVMWQLIAIGKPLKTR
jgi:hypothetical protein